MTRLSEKRDVQDALVNYLIGIGWEYLSPDECLQARGNDPREPFLVPLAREQLVALNASTSLSAGPGLVTPDNVDDVLRRLRGVHPSIGGNEDFLHYLRGHRTVYSESEKRERNLTLIDYDHPERNRFTFTQEFVFEDRDRRRVDLLLFVNGFPVALIENKSPTVPEAELEAFDQVQRLYTERIPELLKFVQLFAACDLRVHYGATWNDDLKAFYRWKVEGKDYGLEALSKALFAREHLLRLLRDYIIFFRADDQTHKFVLRPHQMRAVERIVQRVERGQADTGLIWHTQGSGKTLTMIVAAHKLRRLPSLENPTLLVVVDRRELETQMVQNLEAFGFPAVKRAESKRHLRDLLRSDYRGLIVTLIHKFDRSPRNLSTRRNVVVLIDEAHRSQEGDLATYMRAALPHAFYFGFTGTPVDKGIVGRGTFETFGRADPGGYLDKYGIDESIADGTTVPLYYTLAPTELRVDRETLEEEFFRVVEEMGIASLEELNRLLDKADKLKAVLKAPERVEQIAAHIARHYRENVEPLGFKAFVVAVDREACALYKEALDRYLPEEYSRVVYTPYHKDRALLRRYHLDEAGEKRVRKAFRAPEEMPKILIVTQKLLTGYDAPVLYVMYLDKPLKDHTLLQAIARVNRPYPAKENGLIVDYIGVFENLQRALAFDAATISTGLIDLERLKERFADLLLAVQAAVAPINLADDPGRPARIIDHFFDRERREKFVELFKDLQTAYEILSPDPFLRDYLDDYALIVQVYRVVYNYFNPEAERRRVQRELLVKTDALIRQHVRASPVVDTLPLYPINRDIATVVRADGVSERVKVTNLYRSLTIYIEQHRQEQPYLLSIAERVEEVIRRLRERQISVQAALEQLTVLTEQAVAGKEEQAASELSSGEFALYWVLKGQGVNNPQATARTVHRLLAEHAGWPYNTGLERQVRLELYKVLKLQPRTDAIGEPRGETTGDWQAGLLKETVEAVLRMYRMAGS
ncbi:MAG: HsdR family type I site-specific deoxyribonuclease [Anaerolineae bacterium]|nr:HsdR family type I site-specific deoxyribonuclease [Anaerolineae bacterium]